MSASDCASSVTSCYAALSGSLPIGRKPLARALQRAGFQLSWRRVHTEADYRTALASRFDVIFCDVKMPGFSARRALELLDESKLETPLIIVSGSCPEETVLKELFLDVADVVTKDRLSMLGLAVQRALKSSRDKAERRRLEARLRQAEKMEAIGRVTSSVAHDFNNILMTILIDADLSTDPETIPPQVQEALQSIKLSAQRAACLTRQLLRFGKRREAEYGRIDLNEKVAGISEMLERVCGEAVQLQFRFAAHPLYTQADSSRIDQVLLNLVVNARDAVSGSGQIIIETLHRSISEKEAGTIPNAYAGEYVCLRVADTGCGIAPENIARIFEPFFTTKANDTGTGLGLATVLEIVEQHNGFIKVCSTIGRGTTFEVLLPACNIVASDLPEPIQRLDARGQGETILLVEDDAALCDLTRAALEHHGYIVLDACDAQTALQAWVQHERRIDLLLTDLILPNGASGADLAAQLRPCETRLEVIFMSGYNPEVALPSFELQSGQRFLQKPCSIDELLAAVRGVLDEVARPGIADVARS